MNITKYNQILIFQIMECLKYFMPLLLLIWLPALISPEYQVSAVDIPPEWISYVQKMTEQFDKEPWSPVCIPYKEIVSDKHIHVDGDIVSCNFIPDIILWDPLAQFPTLYFHISKCLADNCEYVMEKKEWQNGQNTNSLPRLIHGIDGVVLLVSRIYVCGSGHRFLSHDERILSRFLSQDHIPFLLSHRSGLTMQCVSLVVSLIGEGKKISSVENALRETRRETFYRNVLCSVELIQKIAKSSNVLKFENSINGRVCPGSKILLLLFLQNFWKHELYYRKRMHEIGISEDWICCDHTFKSVMNIGIYQRRDNDRSKWVKQFKSLFIVLNDIGQVLSWQLADDTSHDTVHETLNEINQRLKAKTRTLKEIYVDDCCRLRNKMQSVFGREVVVKLDIFHAIQRITKKTSKWHSLFYDFVASLKHVFRDPSDVGDVRQLPTPSPKDLENNLDAFVRRWKDVKSHGGKIILTSQVLEEINRLRQHISRGCLSYIRPGRGTNRDESLIKGLIIS